MKQRIIDGIRKIANLLKFAAVLNKESLEDVIKKLNVILAGESDFITGKTDPLMFSEGGLKKLNQIAGENFKRDKTMLDALHTLHRSMELAAKTGNEEMAYALKLFDKSPHSWLKMKLDGMGFFEAKHKVLESFEALQEILKKPLSPKSITPEELKEMQEKGVISHRSRP